MARQEEAGLPRGPLGLQRRFESEITRGGRRRERERKGEEEVGDGEGREKNRDGEGDEGSLDEDPVVLADVMPTDLAELLEVQENVVALYRARVESVDDDPAAPDGLQAVHGRADLR